jgi:hypothetical protein
MCLLGCVLLGACDTTGDRAPSVEVEQQAAPGLIFVVPPAFETEYRPRDAARNIWSPNDDLDSILIVLTGGGDVDAATLSIEVVTEHISLADLADSSHTTAGTNRTLDLHSNVPLRLDTLPPMQGGRLLLVVNPSSFYLPTSRLHLRPHEQVVEMLVSVEMSTGEIAHGRIELLPSI